jgi:4-hydroxy-tetrahydrodipicolinate synthase
MHLKEVKNMIQGSIAALVTPFTQEGEVDYKTLVELIEWHVESGTDGIVLSGITGEAPTLSQQEKIRLFKEGVLAAKGRIPIIAGTGSFDTRETVHLTQEAKKAGVDAALIIQPYFNRPTPEGCFQHYQAISDVGLPMIPYHHPGRTGVKIPVQTLARIAELPSVVAVKESTGDLDYAIELMHQISTPVYTGDDSLVLPMMGAGAVGVISVVANIIPREWKIMTTLLLADQFDEGREFFRRYYRVIKAMFLETNPQCVKYALSVMGKCSSAMRLPMIEPQEAVKQQIVAALSAENIELLALKE